MGGDWQHDIIRLRTSSSSTVLGELPRPAQLCHIPRLRHQSQSALALWFKERATRNGGRHKKTTIVALARKLLVALWKYVTAGVVIEGAAIKSS